MSCTKLGINLPEPLNRVINGITQASEQDVMILSSWFNKDNPNTEMLSHINKYLGYNMSLDDIYNSDNLTVIHDALRDFYIRAIPKVSNFNKSESKTSLFGFSSAGARHAAKVYVGGLYKDVLNSGQKISKNGVLPVIRREVEKNLIDRLTLDIQESPSDKLFTIHIGEDSFDLPISEIVYLFSEDSKDMGESLRDIYNLTAELENQSDFLSNFEIDDKIEITVYQNISKVDAETRYNQIESQLNEAKEKLNIASERQALLFPLIEKYAKEIEDYKIIQQIVLIKNLRAENTEFMDYIYSQSYLYSKMKNISDGVEGDFSATIDINEETGLPDESDGDDHSDRMLFQHINDNSKNGSWKNLIYYDVRLIFDTLYNYTSAETKTLDKNNELGVPTRMNYSFVSTVLMNYADMSSIESFIDSVFDIAYRKRKYAGLITLAESMKADILLANKIHKAMNNPAMPKMMISVDGNFASNIQTNKQINPRESVFNDLVNNLTQSIPTDYINDIQLNIKQLLSRTRLGSKDRVLTNDNVIESELLLKSIIKDLLPNITSEDIDDYLHYKRGDIQQDYGKENQLVKIYKLANILNLVVSSGKSTNSKIEEYNSNKKKDEPYKSLSGEVKDSFAKAINELSNELYKFVLVRNNMNSRNSENNIGSDRIDNMWITSLFQRLRYSIEDEGVTLKKGLKSIYDFYSKDVTTHTNSILFNQYDDNNPNIRISLGLFEHPSRVIGIPTYSVINENAEEFLKENLFVGLKNESVGKNASYENMTDSDYLLSNLTAYFNTSKGFQSKTFAANVSHYFMKTPSDSPKNFIIQAPKHDIKGLYLSDETINKNHIIFKLIRKQILGEIVEIKEALKQINTFQYIGDQAVIEIDNKMTKSLPSERYYYNKGKIVDNDKLTGNVFNFTKLFHITGGIDVNNSIQERFPIITPIPSSTGVLRYSIDSFYLNPDQNSINDIVEQWFLDFKKLSDYEYNQNKDAISNTNNSQSKPYSNIDLLDWALNTTLFYMNGDVIFEGNTKYYKNAQDLFKRNKEVQAGGKSYGDALFDKVMNTSTEQRGIVTVDGEDVLGSNGQVIELATTFNALTITNVEAYSDDSVKAGIRKMLLDGGASEKTIIDLSDPFISNKTTADDAQSIITIEEFIRRRYLDGTIKDYLPIIKQLLDPNVELKDLNTDGLTKIQVGKNFYFDIILDVDNRTKARQIKNSEFVLIPKLLPKGGSLEHLYNIMVKHNISQVNTNETDKAAKRRVITYWNEDGTIPVYKSGNKKGQYNTSKFEKSIADGIETFQYANLYKQLEVPQHIKDTTTKLTPVFIRKMFHNLYSTQLENNYNEVHKLIGIKLKRSFDKVIKRLNIPTKKDGTIDTSKTNLNIDTIYEIFKEEALRLEVTSDFLNYFASHGTPDIPNWINASMDKMESVAQSLFNNNITKQKLAGWHTAQASDVLYDRTLKYAHEKGTMQVKLPRWSSLIPKTIIDEKTGKERPFTPEDLQDGLKFQIAFRMPTEGKQSIITIEVVEFLDDSLGSTIIVPQEWVTQTGSDFDVDSIYGYVYEMYIDKNGVLRKIPYNEEGEQGVYNRLVRYIKDGSHELSWKQYKKLSKDKKDEVLEQFSKLDIIEQHTIKAINNRIVDLMMDSLNHPSSAEEQLGRSHYDDLEGVMKKLSKYQSSKIESISPYNPFSQIENRDKAQSGAILKGLAVAGASFVDLCNVVEAKLLKPVTVVYNLKDHAIDKNGNVILDADNEPVLKYNKEELLNRYKDSIVEENDDYITISHNQYGWSEDGKNVENKLITSYHSQLTAHILDAVKVGALPNENLYTYNTLSNLIALGVDYETVQSLFIHPSITYLANANDSITSNYGNNNSKILNSALKTLAMNLELKVKNGKNITNYTPIKDVILALSEYVQSDIDMYSDINILLNKDNIIKDIEYYNTNGLNKKSVLSIINNILLFDNLQSLSNSISNIATKTVIDQKGTKPTIYESRKLIEDIELLKNDDTLFVETEDGSTRPLLDAVYGDESKYEHLKQVYEYSVKPSVEVNKRVFDLESDRVFYAIRNLEAKYGFRFNKFANKDFKKFIVSYIYNNIDVLRKPITVDLNGDVIVTNEVFNQKDWNEEILRLKGVFAKDVVLDIKDPFNPDSEDIELFRQASPVQKIMYLQRIFNIDSGVFKYIKPKDGDPINTANRGYSMQYLSFSESGDSIENIHDEFNQALESNNPLIKLAAMDIIKYSMLVDGGRFKFNSVSKIVTAKSLLYKYQDDLDISSEGNSIFHKLFDDTSGTILDSIFELYLRQNKSIASTYTINPVEHVSYNKDLSLLVFNKENTTFLNIITKDGFDEYTDLSELPPYINIKFKGSKIDPILYKLQAIPGKDYAVYIPLNTLDKGEFGIKSINPKNVVYNEYKDLANAAFDIITNDGTLSKEFIRPKVTKFSGSINTATQIDPNYLQGISDVNASVRKFIKDINDNYKDSNTKIIIYSVDKFINQQFPKGAAVAQNITIKGLSKRFSITKGVVENENTNVKKQIYVISEVPVVNVSTPVEEGISTTRNSTATNIELTDSPDNNYTNVTSIAATMYRSMQKYQSKSDAFQKTFENAYDSNFKIDENDIESRSIQVIKKTNELVDALRLHILKKSNVFGEYKDENGNYLSITNPKLYEMATEDKELMQELKDFLFTSLEFTKTFDFINGVDISSTDNEMQDLLTNIKNAVSDIHTSNNLSKARNLFLNITIASYSDNPNIKQGLVELTTKFGDADLLDKLFSDIHELSNSEVQVILKMIETEVERVRVVDAPKKQSEVLSKIDELISTGNVNLDNVAKNGKFVKSYNSDFISDRQFFIDKVNTIRLDKGYNSEEYHIALLEKDKWLAENTEQELPNEYYQRKNELIEDMLFKFRGKIESVREIALRKGYIKYKQLQREIADLRHSAKVNKTDDVILSQKLKEMKSLFEKSVYEYVVDSDGNVPKDIVIKDYVADQLRSFRNDMSKLDHEFFEYIATETLQQQIEIHSNYISEYNSKNPYKTFDEKLEDDRFRKSHEWLQNNTIYSLTKEFRIKSMDAFSKLTGKRGGGIDIIQSFIDKNLSIKDESGVLDGRQIPEDVRQQLKTELESKYKASERTTLYRNIPKDRPRLDSEIANQIYSNEEQDEAVKSIILEINNIYEPFMVDGNIDFKAFADYYFVEDDGIKNITYKLTGLYLKLKDAQKSAGKKSKSAKNANDYVIKLVDENSKTQAARDISDSSLNADDLVLLSKFINKNKKYLFGYNAPAQKEFESKSYTAAKFIEENMEFPVTEYYKIAKAEAIENGTFDEWYNANHVLNQYTNKLEPLPYWTVMRVKDGNDGESRYEYIPNADNKIKTISKKNDAYSKYGTNYNGSSKYKNDVQQTKEERELIDYVQNIMRQLASDRRTISKIELDELPRMYKLQDHGVKGLTKNVLSFVGINSNEVRDNWQDTVGIEFDHNKTFDMFDMLKGKGSKPLLPIPVKSSIQSDEDYEKEVLDVKQQNKLIKAENDKIDRMLASNDIREIMKIFIPAIMEHNTIESTKPLFYLMLEDVRNNKALKRSAFKGNLIPDYSKSVGDVVEYQKVNQDNTLHLLKTYYNRFYRNAYKEKSALTKFANMAQSMTSAKYMMLNTTGGIANILTGEANILGEVAAREFLNAKDYGRGVSEYIASSHYIMAGAYSEDHKNEIDGLIKYFDIVDLDQFLERSAQGKVSAFLSKVRDAGYGIQSTTEHFMQNSVLLGMLNSNRIYYYNNRQVVGSFAQFSWHRNHEILEELLKDDPIALRNYRETVSTYKTDLDYQKDVYDFNINIPLTWLRARGDQKLIDLFNKTKKDKIKELEKEFSELPVMRDQFEYTNSKFDKKADSELQDDTIAQFKIKVQSVNKKIHGVYDKLGAASIESKWYGGLLMQYHKHIYPGLLKRFRRKGYYNEFRGSIEKGSHIALFDFLTTEFKGILKEPNIKDAQGLSIVLEGIKNILKAALNTAINVKLNYSTLDDWQQANVRRALTDFMNLGVAISAAVAIGMLGHEDDDIQDTGWYAFLNYAADRWMSEANTFMVWGVPTEGRTLYSQPVASYSLVNDYMKMLSYAVQSLYDDDYETHHSTGKYAGEHKVIRLLINNAPMLRGLDRVNTMADYQEYNRRYDGALDNLVDVIVETTMD